MKKAQPDDVKLINPTLDDYDFYYNLKSEESNIYWSGHKKKPDYEGFKKWYMTNAIEQGIVFKFIEFSGQKAGALYFRVENNECTYLGIAVSELYQGMGISEIALEKLNEYLDTTYPECSHIKVLIRIDNERSIHIHEKLGYNRTGVKKPLYLESDEKEIIMEEWQLFLKK
jgi:RimJ/RimL family protein N-acetyltransferase